MEGGLAAVLKTIQDATLTDTEQQSLVDSLLSKPGHQWTKVNSRARITKRHIVCHSWYVSKVYGGVVVCFRSHRRVTQWQH